MNPLKRTNQGGSIASYIFIGVILAFGLMAGVYYVKQRGDQARKDQAIAIYEKQQASKKAAEVKNQKKPVSVASNSASSANSNKANNQLAATSTTQSMPTTGVEVNFGELFSIFMLTVTMVGYVSSRHRISCSL